MLDIAIITRLLDKRPKTPKNRNSDPIFIFYGNNDRLSGRLPKKGMGGDE